MIFVFEPNIIELTEQAASKLAIGCLHFAQISFGPRSGTVFSPLGVVPFSRLVIRASVILSTSDSAL